MSIKIPNGDTFRAIFQGIERSDGNVAEITKPHRAIARDVMPRRTH
jgi:hypothetical protein